MIRVAEEVVFLIFERCEYIVADSHMSRRNAQLFTDRFLHRLASWRASALSSEVTNDALSSPPSGVANFFWFRIVYQ